MAELVRYEAARVALREARAVDEAKDIHDKAEAVRAYARQVNDTEMVSWASEIKLRAMRRMGELLEETEWATPGPKKSVETHDRISAPTLSDLGVTKDASSLSQKIASIPEEKFEEHLANIREQHKEITVAGVERLTQMAHVGHNSGDNEWYTPKKYITAAVSVMGAIDLDPASNDVANEVVAADKIFTIDDNGLEQTWCGRIWLNPPYAGELIKKFISKLCESYQSGDISSACVLVNNATDTQWFQMLAKNASAVCFPARRIKFWQPGKEAATPLQGQAILYLGKDKDRFIKEFVQFGLVCYVC